MKSSLPGWITAIALIIGLAWTGFLARGHLAGKSSVIDRFETVLLDLRITIKGERTAPEEITIIAIDDRTVSKAGQYPLSRNRLADLIGKIRDAGAKTLAVDILLSGGPENSDIVPLANSLGSIPAVIAAAGLVDETRSSVSAVPVISKVLLPASEIGETASIGLANIVTDSGGTPRHIPLLFLTETGLQPSFSLKAMELFLTAVPNVTETGIRLGDRVQELDMGWHLALNYYGPRGTITTVSAERLLEGERIDLENRIAVLGVTATAVGDRFGTPFDPVLPGVEVQATGIANLLDGSALSRNENTRLADSAAAFAVTLIGLAAVAFLPLAPASIIYLAMLAGWVAITFFLFGQGQWLSGALPFAASLPPVIALIVTRQIFDRFQSNKLMQAQEALSRFQSPRLAKRVAEDPGFLMVPKEQDAAMLFVDLSGYTTLSEQLGPARTRDFLKSFHTIVVDVANKTGGIVLDFMGDGAMLGFGIPETSENDPANAALCAFLLHNGVGVWLSETGMSTRISRVRVGAHYGQVVLSRLGHDRQQQITTTGDCVNVASRLLEVAKDLDASVVISKDLLDATSFVSDDTVIPPRIETVTIRGRQQELQVGLWRSDECPTTSIENGNVPLPLVFSQARSDNVLPRKS